VADIKAKQAVLTEVSWLTTSIADGRSCKGNLTDLRRELHSSLAKGNPKRTL
jgi:hypothetical protein